MTHLIRSLTTTLAAALALFGCATAPVVDRPPEDAIEIAVVVTSWGHPREQWTATARGEAMYAVAAPESDFREPLRTSTGTISPQDFARLRGAMAPLQRFVGVELACPDLVYDAPSAGVRWLRPDSTEARASFYAGCGETPERREIAAALEEAERIFHEATGLR